MYNIYTHIATNQGRCERLTCKDSLFTVFNCKLENKFQDLWSHNNYIVYVLEGKKIWHTGDGSYELNAGDCVFVRKGAAIVEQFFDTEFCFFLFFVPDDFIRDVLKTKTLPLPRTTRKIETVININNSKTVQSYFQSMLSYFDYQPQPDPALLELKFRELILMIADNPDNSDLLAWFNSLMRESDSISLQRVMEDNFSFNLKMEEYARLSARSLSSFKRDFQQLFATSPGKWIMEKRLNLAMHLLTNLNKSVSEAAFESGFENPSHFSRAFRQRFNVSPVAVKQRVLV